MSAWLRARGAVGGEELVRYLVLLGLAVGPLQEVARSGGAAVRFLAVMDRVTEMLDAPVEADAPDVPRLPALRGAIELDAVVVDRRRTGFRFGPLSLAIAAGETVAIVGPSGAGKSTLLDIVARLVEPSAGVVRVDGCPVAGYRRDSLREQVALVAQEPFLFRGTLAENLRFARPAATDAEVARAARAAHVEEFANRLPQGYETMLDPRGANLSVGQRQRIALARAFLRDPRILLLDEPTAALDLDSERLLRDALRRFCAGRTTLIVTHRPSLLAIADRVVTMDGGAIASTGALGIPSDVGADWERVATGAPR
jgi:ABC-type multidrug transport system fused ATPase/permease subunit